MELIAESYDLMRKRDGLIPAEMGIFSGNGMRTAILSPGDSGGDNGQGRPGDR